MTASPWISENGIVQIGVYTVRHRLPNTNMHVQFLH